MASALAASVWLMKGSCLSRASTAEQLGNGSSPDSASMISGNSSLAVRSRSDFAAVARVQRLAEYKLAARRIVAKVEPIATAA